MADKHFLQKLLQKREEKEQKGERRQQHITISGTVLVALSLVLVCAVAWAFFMGFMVGRGQSPHEEIHAITGVNIKPAEPKTATPDMAANETPPQTPETKAESGDNLAEAPMAAAAAAVVAAQAPALKPAPGPQPPKPSQPKPPKNVDNGQKFNYVFQIAAFRSQREAQTLSKQALAKNIKTAVKKSGKVYIVTTNLRGGQEDVAKLANNLKTLKLGKPLQLSKQPIATQAKTGKRANGKKQ